jgi:hypothetical protein
LVVPILVVKKLVDALVAYMRGTGGAFGVEKVICNFVKSIAGAPGARPIANVISSIPSEGWEASPETFPIIWMSATGSFETVVTVIVGTIVVWGDGATVVFWLTHPAVITTATSNTIKRRYFIPAHFI